MDILRANKCFSMFFISFFFLFLNWSTRYEIDSKRASLNVEEQ
jgi:hypothetical protein